MGKPLTLLDRLINHALSFDAVALSVEYKDGLEWVYAHLGSQSVSTARFKTDSSHAKELRQNLHAVPKKGERKVLGGQARVVKVRIREDFGEHAFDITFDLAPALDPSVAPKMTAKQGQYLAYIHSFTKLHRYAPAESDLQRYFEVSAPAVHDMIVMLQRNGFIERTPGQARSIRLLVKPEHLPRLV